MENLFAFVIETKELKEISKMNNFNINGCDIYVKGTEEPLPFHYLCTNEEVYLILQLDGGGGMLKLSDMTKFKLHD